MTDVTVSAEAVEDAGFGVRCRGAESLPGPGGGAGQGPCFAHRNVTVTNARAGLVEIDEIALYSVTAGISEVREFDQIDVPDFTGELHARLESYGKPEEIRPRNPYEAQRGCTDEPSEHRNQWDVQNSRQVFPGACTAAASCINDVLDHHRSTSAEHRW